MAKAPSGNGANHDNPANARPNFDNAAHTSSAPTTKARLTNAQVRAALGTIDITRGSRLDRCARYRAFTADIDADDLLQEAVVRALSSRTCPTHIKIEHFLMGVMRSIASAAIASREKATDVIAECEEPTEALAPDEVIELRERTGAFRRAIEQLACGSQLAEAVVDGIGQGLCGVALADHVGASKAELATVRRMIKRRAANAWTELENLEMAA